MSEYFAQKKGIKKPYFNEKKEYLSEFYKIPIQMIHNGNKFFEFYIPTFSNSGDFCQGKVYKSHPQLAYQGDIEILMYKGTSVWYFKKPGHKAIIVHGIDIKFINTGTIIRDVFSCYIITNNVAKFIRDPDAIIPDEIDGQKEYPESDNINFIDSTNYLDYNNYCKNMIDTYTNMENIKMLYNMLVYATVFPTDINYPLYGGAGIKLDDRWLTYFELFIYQIREIKNYKKWLDNPMDYVLTISKNEYNSGTREINVNTGVFLKIRDNSINRPLVDMCRTIKM